MLSEVFLFAPLGVYRNGSGRRAEIGIDAVGTDDVANDDNEDDLGMDEELNDVERARVAERGPIDICCSPSCASRRASESGVDTRLIVLRMPGDVCLRNGLDVSVVWWLVAVAAVLVKIRA